MRRPGREFSFAMGRDGAIHPAFLAPMTRHVETNQPNPPSSIHRVVLVGMMGSGKTTVGAELARRLGWEHIDLDREIEREAGRAIRDVFATDGEAAFRRMEAEATRRIAGRTGLVLSPGGGWMTDPALLESLGPGTLCVWLQASPEEALLRASAAPGERPLLAGPDPLGTIRRLLAAREPFYARAHLAVATGGRSAGEVAAEIHTVIRARTRASG